MRGSRMNSHSQPTIAAAMSATPSANVASPPWLAPTRVDDEPRETDRDGERRQSSHTRAPRRQCGTTASAKSSKAAVPMATVAISVSPADGGQHLPEVQREAPPPARPAT